MNFKNICSNTIKKDAVKYSTTEKKRMVRYGTGKHMHLKDLGGRSGGTGWHRQWGNAMYFDIQMYSQILLH